MDGVFLNVNVLFSFAYGSAGLSLLLDRARKRHCLLLASQYVVEEASRNLSDPEQIRNLGVFLSELEIVPEVDPRIPSTQQPTALAYFFSEVTEGACLPGDSRRETALREFHPMR